MHAYEYIGRNESGSCQHGSGEFTKKKKNHMDQGPVQQFFNCKSCC